MFKKDKAIFFMQHRRTYEPLSSRLALKYETSGSIASLDGVLGHRKCNLQQYSFLFLERERERERSKLNQSFCHGKQLDLISNSGLQI